LRGPPLHAWRGGSFFRPIANAGVRIGGQVAGINRAEWSRKAPAAGIGRATLFGMAVAAIAYEGKFGAAIYRFTIKCRLGIRCNRRNGGTPDPCKAGKDDDNAHSHHCVHKTTETHSVLLRGISRGSTTASPYAVRPAAGSIVR